MTEAAEAEGCRSSRIVFNIILLEAAAVSADGFRLVDTAAGSRVKGMAAVNDQFIGL